MADGTRGKALCIRVSIAFKKNNKGGPTFGPTYYKGSDGIAGLQTSVDFERLTSFVKEKVLEPRSQSGEHDFLLDDIYDSGACLYYRPEKPLVRTRSDIACRKSDPALVGILSDDDLAKAIRDFSYNDGSRGRILDLVVTCKKKKKPKDKPKKNKRKAQEEPAATLNESSDDDNDITSQTVTPAKKKKAKKKKGNKVPAEAVPDNKITVLVRLLRPTGVDPDPKSDGDVETIPNDTVVAFATIKPRQLETVAESVDSDEFESDAEDREQDRLALAEVARVPYGVLRATVLDLAVAQSAYKQDDKSLVGDKSKLFYRADKRKLHMTRIPENTEQMWRILNGLRTKDNPYEVTIDVSVGKKHKNDVEYEEASMDDYDQDRFSQQVRSGEIVTFSPRKNEKKKSRAARRASSQSEVHECREFLMKAISDPQSPVYHCCTQEMFDVYVQQFQGKFKEYQEAGRYPEISSLPILTGRLGGACNKKHRTPVKGKYAIDNGVLPSYPADDDGSSGLDKLASAFAESAKANKEAMTESAKVTARGLSNVPESFLLKLKFNSVEYSTVVAQSEYDKPIAGMLRSMRKQYLSSGFMQVTNDEAKALKEEKKEVIVYIEHQGSNIRYDKALRASKMVSEWLSLLEKDNNTISGFILVEDLLSDDNQVQLDDGDW
jgi:hypothetical protein